MSKLYNNKTLEEYYALYLQSGSKMSQTKFCEMHRIPRSTFNDYVRKRKTTDIDASIKEAYREEEEIERSLACSIENRLYEMAHFLAISDDCERSKTKLAKCSRYFFWKTAMEYISFYKNDKNSNIEKLFYEEKGSKKLEKIIEVIDCIYNSLFLMEIENNLECLSAKKGLCSKTLTENRISFTGDAFSFFNAALSIIGNTCYGKPKIKFPNTLCRCEKILKKAANSLCKDRDILNRDIIQRIADETSSSYYEVLSVIIDAQYEGKIFGKIFPYDFVE